MAAFLRKKTKDEVPTPAPPPPPPPLFARFATTTKSVPVVSSPMILSRKEQRISSPKKRTTQNHKPLDKPPLPPPDRSGSATKHSRAPSQNELYPRPRAALDDAAKRDGKQHTDENNHASRPPTTNNNPLTSPRKRNSSLSNTTPGPQILPPIANRKMYQIPNPSSSFVPPTTTQTQTLHPVANQDLQPANVNDNMSMIGAGSVKLDDTHGTPISDRGLDLPPEFILFQEFSQSMPEDRNSVHSHRTINHNPVPRSSTYRPSLEPQSKSGMGVATSHAIANCLVPSSIKDFRTSSYNIPNRHDRSHSPPLPPIPSPLLNSGSFPPRTQVPPRPSFHDLQQPNLQNSRKSSIVSQAPVKGRPRIFSAVAAQEDELNTSFQHSSGPVQPVVKERQPQPQHQPSAPDLSAYTNGCDPLKRDLRRVSSSLQPQPQPQPLPPPPLPSTPKFSNHILEQLPPTPPSHSALRSSRTNGSRSLLRQDERPQTPPRARKLSKVRTPSDVSSLVHVHRHSTSSNITLPSTPDSHHRGAGGSFRTLTKSRPTTPVAQHKPLSASPMPGAPLEPAIQLDEDTISNAGIPLDDDPFARVEGVILLKPSNSLKEKEEEKETESSSNGKKHRNKQPTANAELEKASAVVEVTAPPTPISPEEHRKTKKNQCDDDDSQTEPTPEPPPPLEDAEEDAEDAAVDEPKPVRQYMVPFLSEPQLLSSLLTFLSFYDWCILSSLSKEIRILLVRTPVLRETVLEAFLKTVGYSRWAWDDPDPLSLSLQDLSDYMRGVSTPTHEYARVAAMYVHSLTVHPDHRDPSLLDTVRILTASTRAYTRVVLRLRGQAERETVLAQQSRGPTAIKIPSFHSPSPARGTTSRVSSRAPSPTASSYSHSHNGHVSPGTIQQNLSQTSLTFRSPLFRLRRAPLLRVFVPSPEGDWLSDKSVLACEAECKRAGVLPLMRLGDVVWDVAVGDEGNVGRLVWDGSYLIDLDYTYSSIGDLPKYMPTLAFPPSYFHRVIRTGPIVSNPIVHIDLCPWGEEIAMNLQLLQDRLRTETPQGAYHNVVRWVHRSSFVIRPPRGAPARYSHQGGRTQVQVPRIPIPDTDNLFIDSGWYGTIVVETESTNEALADLQERCGPGAFPSRPRGPNHQPNQAQIENRKVFRILREKSRPGEIWIKTVGIKERLL